MVMQIYLVGGAVRDESLGRQVAEKDWCVVGATVDEMLAQGFKPVGKDFPVFLHPETGEEYALARTERKSGQGYHGFTFHTSPDVSIEEDLRRRDLTINAMARLDGDDVLIDPYGGKSDLQAKVLRHVSEAFVEDPVRVLRLARFAAVFPEFSVAEETLHLLRTMVQSGELGYLVPERVWQELVKALSAEAPQRFFAVLLESGALAVLMPELMAVQADLLIYVARVAQALPDVDGRFAAIWGRCALGDLTVMAERVRVPASAMDLAQMVSKHANTVRDLDEMSAEALLAIFESLDIFRREVRFWQWLEVAQVLHAIKVDVVRLQRSLVACQEVDVSALQAEGFSGADLGQAIREQRVERIKTVL